jgi:acyl carrier protein
MAALTPDTRNEVMEVVFNFFSEECEVEISELNENTNIIRDIEGDSLMFLELIEIFKRKYNLNLDLKTIGKYIVKHPVETIGQLIDTTLLMIEHENKIVELD